MYKYNIVISDYINIYKGIFSLIHFSISKCFVYNVPSELPSNIIFF